MTQPQEDQYQPGDPACLAKALYALMAGEQPDTSCGSEGLKNLLEGLMKGYPTEEPEREHYNRLLRVLALEYQRSDDKHIYHHLVSLTIDFLDSYGKHSSLYEVTDSTRGVVEDLAKAERRIKRKLQEQWFVQF